MLPSKARRMSMWLYLLNPLLVLQPALGSDTGSSFSGSLERVGNGSISVRLADRRVIGAMLPTTPPVEARAIAAEYRMGDQVEVTLKAIQPVWEEGTSRYQSLEVMAIQ